MADINDIDAKLGQILTIMQQLTSHQMSIPAIVWPLQNAAFNVYASQPLPVRHVMASKSQNEPARGIRKTRAR